MRVGSALVCMLGWSVVACPLASAEDFDAANALSALRPANATGLPERELGPLATLPRYDLDLTLRDDLNGYVLDEQLTFTNRTGKPLADVVLRLFANSGQATPPVALEDSDCGADSCLVTLLNPSAILVQPTAALAPNARLTIHLKLSGTLRIITSDQTDALNQSLESFKALLSKAPPSDYGLLSFGDGIASLAQFYAVVAQRHGKSWVSSERTHVGDLGAEGVSFVHATVHAPRDVQIACSGSSVESLRAGDPTHRTLSVVASLVRDFALVASRDFVMRSQQVGDISVRAYYLKRDADSGEQVLDAATHALSIFQRRFGPYPFTSLSVAEAALIGGAGGSEFSGLVTVASMLYRPLPIDKSLLSMLGGLSGSPLEFTTAHEVAHQYWYGLVGSDAREHPAVDESLTQWSALYYFEDRYGKERSEHEGDAQVRMNYRMMRSLGEADGAVDRAVDAFASPLAYAGLVYGKGAYFYAALRKQVGDPAFFAALSAYARKYRFQVAPATGLVDLFASTATHPAEIHTLAQRWLHQTHGDQDLGVAKPDNASAANGSGIAGLDLGALSDLPRLLAGSAAGSGKGKADGALDAQTIQKLLDGLQSGSSDLQSVIGGLLKQVDKGIDQLPRPAH